MCLTMRNYGIIIKVQKRLRKVFMTFTTKNTGLQPCVFWSQKKLKSHIKVHKELSIRWKKL